ncbi:MAG: flagellar biosynthesis regulator FlhF [Rhodobacterales bacterium]|nr:MAG: flagellar biosynthesis regulator FlhF [Rhodobacterales bacterium]
MNAFNMAKTAYANTSTPIRTPRGNEYDAFARITHRLKSYASDKTQFHQLVAALHDNMKLWTLLAADVSDQDNTLPKMLRGRVFYLYEFTAQHTKKVLQNQASVDVLIDINTAMMSGLRQKAGV